MSPAEVRSAPVRSNQGVQSLVIVAVSSTCHSERQRRISVPIACRFFADAQDEASLGFIANLKG